ncbi:MAG: glycoside hydrolase family 16 protein [Lachnospiraceae bacterium]|nr:glycoside hydrolase family 16 protein [Lachnospiraceae bacterium]
MKKKAKTLLITSAAVIALTGCSTGTSKKSVTNSNVNVDDSAFRVANKSPDAYEDYGETKPDDYYIKATGFEYDYDNLKYDLVWSDEFDYDGLPDEKKWTYDVGTGKWGWGNNELQRYTDDSNAWVKDGNLTIELRKEKDSGGQDIYTSARLKTKGIGDWLYGKFEIRAKLPKGKGTWPAIWMLPSDTREYGGWPASGEIDIMEHVGYLQGVVHFNAHNKDFNGMNGMNKGRSKPIKGVSDDFHTYTLEWLPDKLIYSVDGEETFTYDPHEYVDEVKMDQWPYDKPFHLLINIAYGGSWGGAAGVDDSCLPQQMQVDYVRVYQSDEISALAK